jgi:predicted metal-binding protein/cyclopropane fatty-acyl-phospholipid synthase-like methyltransferase
MKLPHQHVDVAFEGYQRLEDLATAYWYSEVLFASLELNIFGELAECPATAAMLAVKTGYDADGLSRFLSTLAIMGLVVEYEGEFSNGPLASKLLTPSQPGYLGDFLLYRRYFAPHWRRLAARIRHGASANDRTMDESAEQYRERTLAYVRALDRQAGLKAAEALDILEDFLDSPPRLVLDAGGGAGAWCRALLNPWPSARAVLLELPETVRAARKLYPEARQWERIETVAGSILDPCIGGRPFDLIVASNVIHAYGREEAAGILANFAACLAPGGTLVVHDYVADRHDKDEVKGALYDLHMLLNTYNGRVYGLDETVELLQGAGFDNVRFVHLETDTSLFLAKTGPEKASGRVFAPEMLAAQANRLGFSFARVMDAEDIAVAPWVRLKCRFGCERYGRSLCCPPSSLDEEHMRALLSGYRQALLVQGPPPSGMFHERLLALERMLFLQGYHEALAFGAGPCPVCPACPEDGRCRFPQKARPSLEACGVDVYETARRAGLSLNPVSHRQGYVKYVGLVLFDRKGRDADTARSGSLDA